MQRDLEWQLELYRRLLLVRRSEEKIQDHYPEDEMKTPVHLCIGQEAVAVGVCDALGPDDQVVGTYRSHGIYLARTDDPEGLFGELYGRTTGPSRGKGGSMHLASPRAGVMLTSAVVGTTIPVGIGLAYANQVRQNGRMVAAFFGDGAIDEGVFWESLNFACLKALPILLVCEDNGLAIHSPERQRHGYGRISDIVERFDCHVLSSDSTNVAEISRLTRDGLERQRQDGRPVFLHLETYRYVEHVGPRIEKEFHLGFRTEEEFEDWMARDPIDTQRSRLLALGAPESRVLRLEKEMDERLDRCIAAARVAPLPADHELNEGTTA